MTIEVKLHLIKDLSLLNVLIYFYQNRFLNECDVRCRRAYVPNNYGVCYTFFIKLKCLILLPEYR